VRASVELSHLYSLLFAEGVVAIREGPADLSNLLKQSTLTTMINRMSAVIVEPFYALIFPPFLLVVLRMSVELYYDIAYGGARGSMVIIDPNKK
jgi:hypothetical protein